MQKILAVAAKAAISLALLYFAMSRVNLTVLGERLAQLRVEWLLAAVALLTLQVLVVALRWREIARQCGAEVSPARAFRFTLIAGLFNQALPSTVGGDAARIWFLAREGAGWAKATYSVVVDRAVGVLMLALLVLVCLPWSLDLIRNPVGRLALVAIGLGCVAAPAAFIVAGYGRWEFLQRWWLTRHVTRAAGVAGAVFASPRPAALVTTLSLLVHLMTVLAAFLAARSVAAPFTLVHSLLLVPPILLIATVPISIAGWGVRESAMVLAFSYAGLPESDGLLVSVLLGLAMFAVGLIGGLVWLLTGAPRPALAAAEQGPDAAARSR